MLVSSLFSDHAVLPRRREIRVFGTTAGTRPVSGVLEAADGTPLARAEALPIGGRFLLRFAHQEAQTGCTLTLRQGDEAATARDIAIGDVFLAGGQSNMEWSLWNSVGGQDVIREVNDPLLRWYNVPRRAIADAETERLNQAATWQCFEAGQGGDLSGAAAFFALKARAYTGVPIGIVDCYWGGTSISCWLDAATLAETAAGQAYLDRYERDSRGCTMAQYLKSEAAFQAGMDAWNQQVSELRAAHPDWSGTRISQAAGPAPWNPPVGPGSPYRPCGLWETMVQRLAGLSLTGILFYQGETDAGQTDRYDLLLTALITKWRRHFMDPALPFLNTQLPRWIEAGRSDSGTWPLLRAQQEAVYRQVSGTGLAVMIDQGEFDNLHPTDKRPVGERLFEQAKTLVWHDQGLESPRLAAFSYSQMGAVVRFDQPLVCRPDQGEPPFELLSPDGSWYPAACRLLAGGLEAEITSPQVTWPQAVRYAWLDWCPVPLFSQAGLPLAPFTTAVPGC